MLILAEQTKIRHRQIYHFHLFQKCSYLHLCPFHLKNEENEQVHTKNVSSIKIAKG